jgi:hypothetical protein
VTDAITANDYLFIPAAGDCGDGAIGGVGDYCSVWTSALNSENVLQAWYFFSNRNEAGVSEDLGRCDGHSVRGIVGYTLSQIEVESHQYSSGDGGYKITLSGPIDSNATNIRLCVTSNMKNGGYTEYPLTSISEDVNLFVQSPNINCSDLDIKYELSCKTYLISGWNISCIS